MVQAAVDAYERRLHGEYVDLGHHMALLAHETRRIWEQVELCGEFSLVERAKLRHAIRLEFPRGGPPTDRVAVRVLNSAGIHSQILVRFAHLSFVDCLVRFNTIRLRIHAERPVPLAPMAARRRFARYAGWLHSELARLMPTPPPGSQ